MERAVFAGLYGPSGDGKTFVALDVALSVATGQVWQGRAVKRGPVVYVVAEGGHGIQRRIRAWLREHKLQDVDHAHFVNGPVQFLNAQDVQDLLNVVAALPVKPVLIVLDTFARCFVGGDENAAKDMGLAVDAVGRLISNTGATVLLLHHPARGAGHERGHTSLRGAADVMILLKRDKKSGVITLTNDKQKNAEEFASITLKLKQVCLGTDAAGNPATSCVLEACGDSGATPALGTGPARALAALIAFPNGVARPRDWRSAMSPAVPNRTFYNWLGSLVTAGLVEKVPGALKLYRVTDAGRSASANPVP